VILLTTRTARIFNKKLKIISGGQTGVDRAALDFALMNHLACGGWCPRGRLAEDGRIDDRYPLQETTSTVYAERTRLNVEYSDGTLILFVGELSGGSKYTADHAVLRNKPLFVVNVADKSSFSKVQAWIQENDIETLNIAGPRESTVPGIYEVAMVYLERLFSGG
jgi:hypothetical protein